MDETRILEKWGYYCEEEIIELRRSTEHRNTSPRLEKIGETLKSMFILFLIKMPLTSKSGSLSN